MEKHLNFILCGLFLCSCAPHEGYTLRGEVPEAWEGKSVVLYTTDAGTPQAVDSTIVADGRFEIKGRFEQPRGCRVAVYLDPENRSDRTTVVECPVYVDSTVLTLRCDASQQKSRWSISGGAAQGEYEAYRAALEPLVRSYNEAFKSYTQAFYYGDDLQKGIEWAAKTSERNFARTRFSIDYVRKHPESVVSLEILQELCRRQTELDKEEIEALFESLAPQLRDSEAGRYTGQCIREKNIWVGHAVPDLELRDLELRRCRLSDHIRPGHVTLIEIWASWCNPCRGDIPYVKRAYDIYHKRGFDIVGISIDDAAERWKRAVEEENMPWPQLNDPEKKSFRLFDTKAVPTAILIDEEGRILKLNARGGWLFATLQQIYGK